MDTTKLEANVVYMLDQYGENPHRDGLLETPARVVKAWGQLLSGYDEDPEQHLKVFESPEQYSEIVLLKNCEFVSVCEHHMLPFYGVAHIAYIPDGKVIGISKLARLLNVFARRLQIQERLGVQVTDILRDRLGAKAAACVIEAKHMCMIARGVEKQGSTMITSSLTGVFKDNASARAELFSLIKG